MTEEPINTLVKYLGCISNYLDKIGSGVLTLHTLIRASENDFYGFRIDLSPLSALTQEDFERMLFDVNGFNADQIKMYWSLPNWIANIDMGKLSWMYADWLRNNGYYLEEESINKFVKLK